MESEQVLMPWGKYKNRDICLIDASYLQLCLVKGWLSEENDKPLYDAVNAELKRRAERTEIRYPTGKWKGYLLSDIPLDVLRKYANRQYITDVELRQGIENEIDRRKRVPRTISKPEQIELADSLIENGYEALSWLKYVIGNPYPANIRKTVLADLRGGRLSRPLDFENGNRIRLDIDILEHIARKTATVGGLKTEKPIQAM